MITNTKTYTMNNLYTGQCQAVELVKTTRCYYVVSLGLVEYRFHKQTMTHRNYLLTVEEV